MEVELLEVGLTVSEGTSSEFDGPGLEKEFKRGQFAVEWYHNATQYQLLYHINTDFRCYLLFASGFWFLSTS